MERHRSILHIDGDAFFASCEQAADPRLKGKPVVTGYERGMAVAVSYEAKKLGIKRGDLVYKIRREHPECIVSASHYTLYEQFSKRMLDIVRRYTPSVEEYSIDECFADLSDAYLSSKMTPVEIAQQIKRDIELELGMTFSLGVGPTKSLAKIASNKNKPAGFVYVTRSNHEEFLRTTIIGDVWGIGRATSLKMQTYGIHTAYDFAHKDIAWVEGIFAKPCVVIWHELRGRNVMRLVTTRKNTFDSISKTRTFRPPTSDTSLLFAQLSKNIEGACQKARRYNLSTNSAHIFIKTQDFTYHRAHIRISGKTNVPTAFIACARDEFVRLYTKGVLYRATGITLTDLTQHGMQESLFVDTSQNVKFKTVFQTIDTLSEKYGSRTIFLGSSVQVLRKETVQNRRAQDVKNIFRPISSDMSRRVYVPICGSV
jgi:DNA polymerase-4